MLNSMPRLFQSLITISLLLHPFTAAAEFCKTWGEAKILGHLDSKKLPEASGVAASLKDSSRLYWINDSNNKDAIYVTDLNGQIKREVEIKAPKFRDTEALTSTQCGEAPCLIVFDTGDNYHRRKSARLAVFLESDLEQTKASPVRDIRISLPEGAADIEAGVALPGGKILLFSKELGVVRSADSDVYQIDFADWWSKNPAPKTLGAKKIGTLPISQWLNEKKFLAKAITDASLNRRRSVIGLLTYSKVIEIPLDRLEQISSSPEWKADQDFSLIEIKILTQQETLVYAGPDDMLLWSSEAYPPKTPVYGQVCEADHANNHP